MGAIEFLFRAHLTRDLPFAPVLDSAIKFILFAGIYAFIFGVFGLAASLVLGWWPKLYSQRRPVVLAWYLLLVEVVVMYVSMPINKKLPPLSDPKSIAVNGGLILGAILGALALFVLTGKQLSNVFPKMTTKKFRWPLQLFALLLVLGGIAGAAVVSNVKNPLPPLSDGRATGPNIVLITVDTLRSDHLPCYGYKWIRTPAVDRLARNGTVFENAFAATSWTLPSFAAMMAGRTPRALHVQRPFDTLPVELTTVAGAMAQTGRATMAITSNAFLTKAYGFDRGFDRITSVFDRTLRPGMAGIFLFDQLFRLQIAIDDGIRVSDLASEQLPDLQGRGFFLWLHYMDPHKPYGGPWVETDKLPAYDNGYDGSIRFIYGWKKPVNELGQPLSDADLNRVIALYDADIMHFDRELDRLFYRFESLGLMENTIFVLVSDHGEEFLEHGAFAHGKNLHAEETKVPLIFYGPGIPVGHRVKTRVPTLDLPVTLCELAGAKVPDTFTGQSLSPLFFAEGEDREVFGELQQEYFRFFSARTGQGAGSFVQQNVIAKETEMYDLAQDPLEKQDLSESHPELTKPAVLSLGRMIDAENARAMGIKKGAPVDLTRDHIDQLQGLGYILR